MRFEYVISGMSMTRIVVPVYYNFDECVKATIESVTAINKNSQYNLSCLFNGFVEVGLGQTLNKYYRDCFHHIHVDSGGLQVITLGKKVTDDFKKKIYEVQATMGDVAMCFDEIPLIVDENSSNQSNRTSIGNKTFVVSELKASAQKTGMNINEQLREFSRLQSKAKVMMIIQGNTSDDFAAWGETVYSCIDDDLKDKIHGIALADTCSGNGMLETIEMLLGIQKMNVPDSIKRHIHFLGVGSLSRLVPIIEMSKSPLFADKVISFDSTSHSNCFIMGKYVDESGKMCKFGTSPNKKALDFLNKVYNRISEYYQHDISFTDFASYTAKNISSTKHLNDLEDGSMKILSNLTYWFTTLISIENFMDAVVSCYNCSDNYYNYLNKAQMTKPLSMLKLLANVQSLSDFTTWYAKYAKYIPSARITRVEDPSVIEHISLDNF